MSTASEVAAQLDFALVPPQGIEIPAFHELLAELREEAPTATVRYAGQETQLVLRYDDILAVLRNEAEYSSRLLHEQASFPVMGRNVMGMEGVEHAQHRKLVKPPLQYGYVMEHYVEPILRPLCDDLVSQFIDNGEADLVADFTRKFPLTVISKLLGLPIEDEQTFSEWAMALISFAFVPEESQRAAALFDGYLRPLLAERRAKPSDDLLSHLIRAETDGQRLTDEEILAFIRVLFAAGTDTTYNAVGSLLHALLTHPDVLERVRKDPELRPAAIEELLRWNGPVGVLPRITAHDVNLHGKTIEAGQYMIMAIASANRDPRVFERPADFNIDRRENHHIAFGFGVHFCLGAHLARAELRVALDAILERLQDLQLIAEPTFCGSVLRGPDCLPVTFTPRTAEAPALRLA